ncbi:SubName: Full=Uncharacterized protein {ECO:0000313/EMBL:CCA78069.1} [Serendipita indica DSM 11827]|nr:SubName: Full=Uncharacterized protein {ECO:0000313/EMBL:CCA78069.1} [Serendipita indica DSM 11827]
MPQSDQHYGRNRESLAGLIEQLEEIFKSQPTVKKRPDGQLVLPVAGVREVLKILFEQANMPPFNKQDEESLEAIKTTHPELELSPSNLLEFVAQLTANMPPENRLPSVPRKASPTNEAYILGDRGRTYGRNESGGSRSSSSDSLELNHYDDPDETQHFGRRAVPSGFDARARQRTAPVEPPSSWGGKRPVPASRRRRSDAGSNYGGSDNESSYGYGHNSGRRRTSNPVSPSSSFQQSGMMFRPPSRQGSSGMDRYSRPHSRSHSSLGKGGSSSHRSESPDAMLVQYSPPRKNSIPIPGMGDDDDQEGDGQEGDDEAHLVPDPRLSLISFTSSVGDSEDQREALQKALAEITRRAADTERNLQEQLLAREADIDDIQKQLENTRETISILRKDEKEWRRHYVSQINGLEAELNKLQRNLDVARSQHQTLSKQHAEQTAELDKHKVTVRAREGEIRELEHRIDTVEHECEKARAEHEIAEEQVKQLQIELAKANEVHAEYLQQKQENMVLKETIDRLRYDLDDLRTAHANDSTKGGSSAPGSAMPTMSRSLGSELLRRLNPTEETPDEGEESDTTVEETVEEKIENADGEEDVFQTIITRKRKIVGKGKRVQESVLVDASTQYDEELFKSGEEKDVKPVVKVEAASPRSRLLQLPLEDPPSYHLSELEQSGEETMSILRKWHGVKVLGPLPGGISREAVDDWHALKRELGIKCPIIEEIIEQSDKQGTGSRTPGFTFSPIKKESARRYVEGGKRRFYNIYNTYILGGEGASTSASAQREGVGASSGTGAISTGKWVIAFGAWSAFLLWVGSGGEITRVVAPGAPTYADRALWSSFNALTGGAGEGFGATAAAPPVDAVGAVWFVVEKLVRGATEIATRRIAFPS